MAEREEDLGFSRPDSEYEPARVIDSAPPQNDRKADSRDRSSDRGLPDDRYRGSDRGLSDGRYHGSDHSLSDDRYRGSNRGLTDSRHMGSDRGLSDGGYQEFDYDPPVREEAPEKAAKALRGSNKRLLYILLAVIVIVIAFLYIRFGKDRTGADYQLIAEDAIALITDGNRQKTYVFDSQGNPVAQFENDMMIREYSMDHSAALLYDMIEHRYVFINKDTRHDFEYIGMDAHLSIDGKFVLYAKQEGINKSSLYLYDAENKKDTLIDNRENVNYVMPYVVPGGKMLSYTTYPMGKVGEDGGSQQLEIHTYIAGTDRKPELYSNERLILAISGDGSIIYYSNYGVADMGMYAERNGKSTLLMENFSVPFYFNRDLSEILYRDGNSCYISVDGGERKKLQTYTFRSLIMPQNEANSTSNGYYFSCYPIKSFRNKLFFDSSNYIRGFDENYLDKYVATADNGEKGAAMARDGSGLLHLDADKRLIHIPDPMDPGAAVILASDVRSFQASPDLSQVYYLRDHQLYYKAKKGDETLVCDGVADITMNRKGDILFLLKDPQDGKRPLYYTKSGSEPVPVEGGEDTVGLYEWNSGVIYQKLVNGMNTIYYNTVGTDFTHLVDDVDYRNVIEMQEGIFK